MFLGQSGVRFQFGRTVVYIDPYLTERVAEIYGPQLRRLVPAPVAPERVTDADWVLITHEHEDHFDPWTIEPLARASTGCRFVGPAPLGEPLRRLVGAGARVRVAREGWEELGHGVRTCAVPAAHPAVQRGVGGDLHRVGYLLEYGGRRLYHAGDTSPDAEVVAAVRALGPVDVAFLPVNERNHYRDRQGILGNMSVREAFQVAEEIGVRTLVPIHWDLFAANCVFPEEIEAVYRGIKPPFELLTTPSEV